MEKVHLSFSLTVLFLLAHAFLFDSLCCLVGSSGLEPPTSRLSAECSNQLSYGPIVIRTVCSLPLVSTFGGDEGNRTPDPLLAGQVLSQLSYTPL